MKVLSNLKLSRRLRDAEDDIDDIVDGTTPRTGEVLNTANGGTAGAATVSVANYGDGMHHITVLTLTDFVIGTPGAGANLAIGAKVFSFPAGAHVHYASRFNLGLTQAGATTDTPDVGLGSVVASGAVAVLGGTATFEDYITGQTWAVALDGTLQASAPVGATAGVLTGISLNDTGDVKDVFLNAADGWDAAVTGDLTASGTIVLVWDLLT